MFLARSASVECGSELFLSRTTAATAAPTHRQVAQRAGEAGNMTVIRTPLRHGIPTWLSTLFWKCWTYVGEYSQYGARTSCTYGVQRVGANMRHDEHTDND